MNKDYPEVLQVEVTNKCNFNCYMCIRRFWNANLMDLNLNLYERALSSISKYLKRIVLYGFGEPLINPNFIEMLRIARDILSKDSEIIVSTNGSMLNPTLFEKMARIGVDNILFSVDTVDACKLKCIREGAEPRTVLNNLYTAAKIKRRNRDRPKLGVEVVLMKSNFMDLPSLIEKMAEENIDYIIVSNVVPYSEEIFRETVYITVSRKPLEIVKLFLEHGRKAILDAIYEAFSGVYGVKIEPKFSKIIDSFWREAEEAGYWINLPLLFESVEKISMIGEVEKVFELSRKMADEYGVSLSLPNLYPDARNRRCPYVDKKAAFIRSDGAVAPCQEFAYKHPVYINMHIKTVNPVIFGDLKHEDIMSIWGKGEYVTFRETRRKLSESIPWCGDCLYSIFRCFFVESNSVDCFVNKPSCSECLYSANISQCNI
ncbi:MAG: radical SAM protein [Candidatus Bathyarchaeia archaeon]|nr:radical SAM protein [Candidatus Bathyarchaeota archaeon]